MNWAKKSPEGCLRSARRNCTACPAPITCSREPGSCQANEAVPLPASVLPLFPAAHCNYGHHRQPSSSWPFQTDLPSYDFTAPPLPCPGLKMFVDRAQQK